jgi:two-component system sensor histidine kinase DegS
VIQEALNNVRKHSHAKNVLIYLEFLDKMLNIRINDDGVGFDSKAILKIEEREHAAGFGLYSMKERVTLLNGKFDIITSPGEGTTIFASIPIEREHETNG